ncbi:hypothetical protein ACMFMG_005058 [Clarireedia jacksonii]
MVNSPSASPPPSTPKKGDATAPSPTPGTKSASITIKVCDQGGQEIIFRLKRNKELGKLMAAYCQAKSIQNPTDVRFFTLDGFN